MVASSAICDLLYQLEYPLITKDFSIPLMQYLCAWNSKTGFLLVDKVVVSRCRQEVWDELEGGGTKYSNCIYYCLKHTPLLESFSHRHLDRRLRSAEFLLYFSMQSALTNLSALLKL